MYPLQQWWSRYRPFFKCRYIGPTPIKWHYKMERVNIKYYQAGRMLFIQQIQVLMKGAENKSNIRESHHLQYEQLISNENQPLQHILNSQVANSNLDLLPGKYYFLPFQFQQIHIHTSIHSRIHVWILEQLHGSHFLITYVFYRIKHFYLIQ